MRKADGDQRRGSAEDAGRREAHRQEAVDRLPEPLPPGFVVLKARLRGGRAGRNLLRQGACGAPPRRADLGRVHRRVRAGRRPADRHRHARARPHALDDGQLQAEAGCRQRVQEAGRPEGMRQHVGRLGRGEDHG